MLFLFRIFIAVFFVFSESSYLYSYDSNKCYEIFVHSSDFNVFNVPGVTSIKKPKGKTTSSFSSAVRSKNNEATLVAFSSPIKKVVSELDSKSYDLKIDPWQVELKSKQDLMVLFLNLIEKSDYSIDDAINELINLSWTIKTIEDKVDVGIDGGTVFGTLSDIVGVGKLITHIKDVIGYNQGIWYTLFSLWTPSSLQTVAKEYSNLISLLNSYLDAIDQDYYFSEDQSSLFVYEDAVLSFNGEIFNVPQPFSKIVKSSSSFLTIKSVMDLDENFFESLSQAVKNPDRYDVFFWTSYMNALKKKTLDVLEQISDRAMVLYTSIEEIQKDSSYHKSDYFVDNISELLEASSLVAFNLEKLKRAITLLDFDSLNRDVKAISFFNYQGSKSTTLDSNYSSKFTTPLLLKKIRSIISKSYLQRASVLSPNPYLFFDPIIKIVNAFINLIQKEYVNTVPIGIPDELNNYGYRYFTSFKDFPESYINYLTSVYGEDLSQRFLKAVGIDSSSK